MSRLTEIRNGKNVIPLRSAVCGADIPYWRLSRHNNFEAYLSGDAADKLAAYENAEPRWISVEERLPEDWKEKGGDLINYLVFMPEYGVDVGNYAKPVKTWLCMGIPCKVTHWMPLPEPPKEEV